MATRRKYKAHDPVPDGAGAAPEPAPPAADDNPLRRVHDALVHAEELQRRQHAARQQPQQPAPQAYHGAALTDEQQRHIAHHIDSLPISRHKKQFLAQYPQLLVEPLSHVMAHHYKLALHSGVPDDTEHMNQAVLEGIDRDIATHQRLMQAHAQPQNGLAQAHLNPDGAADELAREAAAHLAANEQPPSIPKRRSIQMSAPVSKDVPSASGERRPSQVTLSREEREVAHGSFKHLPKDQAELAYARNKMKMIGLKKSGQIQGDG